MDFNYYEINLNKMYLFIGSFCNYFFEVEKLINSIIKMFYHIKFINLK